MHIVKVVAHVLCFMFLCSVETATAQSDGTDKEAVQPAAGPGEKSNNADNYEEGGENSDIVPSEVEQRELGADEDPMAVSKAQREIQREEEVEGAPERTTGFDIYGSVRVRYRRRGDESGWQDGSSRLGIEVDWQFLPGSYLYGRYEFGFNVLTGLDLDKDLGDLEDTIFTRLRYVGIDSPHLNLIVGKNWSPYYAVAAFTDRFEGAGGVGSGTYNALTDGGPTGTGRADQALQGKLSLDFLSHKTFKPFDLNLQFQHGNTIPFGDGAEYGTAVGASAVMETRGNFALGLAYNHASIDLDQNPSLREIGIGGSAKAILVGTRAFGERWYAGFTITRLSNHETTDEGVYFDGWGSEFYGQYRVSSHLWLVGGYNVLEPNTDESQAGDFRVRYALLGLRYSFEDFRRMIWANVRINDGLDADGTPRSNVYTIGVRWDLSKSGWHLSQ